MSSSSGFPGKPNNKRTLSDFHFQLQQHNPPFLHHLQQQQQPIGPFCMRSVKPRIYQNNTVSVVPSSFIPNGVVLTGKPMDTEKKINMNRLRELEKQLLDDDDIYDLHDVSDGSDSVVTGNEWIQNLIDIEQKCTQQVMTSSPTSSTSTCSSTVASPVLICVKQLITDAAVALADGKLGFAKEIVTRVEQFANPIGTPEQRLAYYISVSLKNKLIFGENQVKSAAVIGSKEHCDSVQLLYQHADCFKLGFIAANLEIIEATEDVKCLHIVDFGLGDGKQYQNLLQLIASHKSAKPVSLKITALNVLEINLVDNERLRNAFDKLRQLSRQSGIQLEVKTVSLKRVADVTRKAVCSNETEVLAVNLAHILSKLPDESVSTENQRDELLRRVKSLKPRIVTVTEQDMNCNTAPFQTRVSECYTFYSALFESLDSNMSRDDPGRIRVEEGLGRVMLNVLACEGVERVERCEVLGKWWARMGMAGFEMKPVSENIVDSSSLRIDSNNVNSGRVGGGELFAKEVNGGVCFGWMGRVLTVTSAWR